MKFDSNQAWKHASAKVAANRDLLIALAGVFFLLPSLAFSLLLPQPQPQDGAATAEIIATAQAYYLRALPFVIPMLLLQATGTLAILTLVTDRRGPTVGESIRQGLSGIVPYLLAQLILGAGLGLGLIVVTTMGTLSGSRLVLIAILIAAAAGAFYVAIRTSLTGPVVAVERVRSPLAVLRRSWRITQGNTGRMGVFYLLVAIAFLLVISIVMAIVGIALALVVTSTVARVIAAVISAVLGTTMSVYFVAILAAIHQQLAGSPTAPGVATEG